MSQLTQTKTALSTLKGIILIAMLNGFAILFLWGFISQRWQLNIFLVALGCLAGVPALTCFLFRPAFRLFPADESWTTKLAYSQDFTYLIMMIETGFFIGFISIGPYLMNPSERPSDAGPLEAFPPRLFCLALALFIGGSVFYRKKLKAAGGSRTIPR